MNSTPPIAWLNRAVVRGAVWPMYSPTRSARLTSTRWPWREHAELGVDPGQQPGHGGLGGAGVAGEDHVPGLLRAAACRRRGAAARP